MSLSKAKKPTAIKKRLKMFVFGPAGVGKTTAAIQFPKPVLVDTEAGAENDQYVKKLNAVGGIYLGPREGATNFETLMELVRDLLSKPHDYRTLVIDPLTVVYNNMLDEQAAITGTDYGKHKAIPDRKIKALMVLLTRLDLNVVITSHQKAKWVKGRDSQGRETLAQEGDTFDCMSKLDYMFDLALKIEKRGKDRFAQVIKTRVEEFPEDTVLPFSYAEFAKRYGMERMEAAAVPVALATKEQAEEAAALAVKAGIAADTIEKWMAVAQANDWDDMPADTIAKCIAHMRARVTPITP